jgi:hypothetical protein
MGTGTSKSERRRISRFASAPNGGSAGRRVAHQGSKLFLHRLSLNRSAVAFRRFESQRFKKLRISIAYTKSTTPPIVKRSPALFFPSVERAELKRCEYQLFTQGSHDGVDRETPSPVVFFAENSKNGSKNCEYQSVTQDLRRGHLEIVTWHGLYIPVETAFIAVDKHSFLSLFRG